MVLARRSGGIHHTLCNELGCHPDCTIRPQMRSEEERLAAPEYGKWEYYHVCTKCDKPLAQDTIYYGGGICPHL